MLRKHHKFRQGDKVRNSDVFLLQFLTPLLRNNNSNSRELGIPVVLFSRERTTVVERLISEQSEERTPEFVSRDRINTQGLKK